MKCDTANFHSLDGSCCSTIVFLFVCLCPGYRPSQIPLFSPAYVFSVIAHILFIMLTKSLLRLASFSVVGSRSFKRMYDPLNSTDEPEYVFWMGCLKNKDSWFTPHLTGGINESYSTNKYNSKEKWQKQHWKGGIQIFLKHFKI